MDIKKISTEALKEELARREAPEPELPEVLISPDLGPLIKLLVRYRDWVASDEFCDDDNYEHAIYEAAINAVFGNQFWTWYNEKVR